MASTAATMALLNPKSLPLINNKLSFPPPKSASVVPLKLLFLQATRIHLSAGSALAGAMFDTIAASEPALAAQQIAEGDSRGLTLLLPIVPAVTWLLFNILQPAPNHITGCAISRGIQHLASSAEPD